MRTVKELDALEEEAAEDIEDGDISSDLDEDITNEEEDDGFIVPDDEVEETMEEPVVKDDIRPRPSKPRGRKKKTKNGGVPEAMDPLAALRAQILGRAQERHQSTVDFLAEKYGGGSRKSKTKKGKKRGPSDEKRPARKKSKPWSVNP